MSHARNQATHPLAPHHPTGQGPAPRGGIAALLPVYAAAAAVAVLVAVGLGNGPQYIDRTVDPAFDNRGKWSGYAR